MERDPAKAEKAAPTPLIIDSGAIIGFARGDLRARRFIERAIDEGDRTVVPPVVIAETTRGGPRDARVNQVLKLMNRVSTINEATGRLAGRLLGKASSDAVIDALVVATAIELGGGRILTSDPGDLIPLAANNPEVTVNAI